MTSPAQRRSIEIVPFSPAYLDAFARLNRAWLVENDLLEDGDLKHLDHPRESILSTGGEIFFALDGGEVVGTCAVIVKDPRTVELVKLTVAAPLRCQGLGRRLTETAIDWARARGMKRVWLVSSSKLPEALRLYEKLGFEHRPLPSEPGYATADVSMELRLDARD